MGEGILAAVQPSVDKRRKRRRGEDFRSCVPRVVHVPTPPSDARRMLRLADLKPYETLYDLGCGTGSILLEAARSYKEVKCVGIETDLQLVKEARKRVEQQKLQSRVKIIHGNFFEKRFWSHQNPGKKLPFAVRNADVITLYLIQKVNNLLQPLLAKEVREGTRIVSRNYTMENWVDFGTSSLHLYVAGRSFKLE